MVCVRQHRCTLSEVLVELASLLRTVAAFATFIVGTQCFFFFSIARNAQSD